MKLTFSGKKILILGGSSRVGVTLAQKSIESGLKPFLTYPSDESLGTIQKALGVVSEDYQAVQFRFGDQEALEALFLQFEGTLDYLVDLAHTDYELLVASAEPDHFRQYFDYNISFRTLLVKKVGCLMLPAQGKVGIYLFYSSRNSQSRSRLLRCIKTGGGSHLQKPGFGVWSARCYHGYAKAWVYRCGSRG